MHSRQTAMPLLVDCGNQPVVNGDALSLAPQRRHFNMIDAVPPGVPLRQRRLIESAGKLQLVEITPARRPISLSEGSISLSTVSGRTRAKYERSTLSSSY